MAKRPTQSKQAAKLVIAALRRICTRKKIDLSTVLDDLGLSGAEKRSFYAAIRAAVSELHPRVLLHSGRTFELDARASLHAKAFARARTVGDVVDVVERALRGAPKPIRTGGFGIRIGGFTWMEVGRAPSDHSGHPKSKARRGGRTGVKVTKSAAPPKKKKLRASARRTRYRGSPRPSPPRHRVGHHPQTSPPPAAPLIAPAPVPETERQISIWISDGKKRIKRVLKIGETYVLNFKVGEPVAESFIAGPNAVVPASDIPAGGQQRRQASRCLLQSAAHCPSRPTRQT